MRTFSLVSLAAILNYLTLPSAVGSGPVANASSYKCQDRVIGPVTLNDQIEKAYREALEAGTSPNGLRKGQKFGSRYFNVILKREEENIKVEFFVGINYLKEIIYLQAYVQSVLLDCYPTTERPQLNIILH
uniref:AvrPm3a2f2_K n=1 Tax=Blumeria graminis f. sp. tritici TaxID=62690 RepID=A0A2P0ZE92_BLUGR|nr:AvrPm3a2f2_K [Blumeria graminis f. sp. tritici]